jgi:hypothetical protein
MYSITQDQHMGSPKRYSLFFTTCYAAQHDSWRENSTKRDRLLCFEGEKTNPIYIGFFIIFCRWNSKKSNPHLKTEHPVIAEHFAFVKFPKHGNLSIENILRQLCFFSCLFALVLLEFELRTSHLLGRYSTT